MPLTVEKKVLIDEQGYLVYFQDWDENVARTLAAGEGIAELTEDGMSMLRFIREHYKKYDFFPILRSICKNIRQKNDCVRESFMNPMTAWKIAGLPRPDEPVLSLLEAGQSPG